MSQNFKLIELTDRVLFEKYLQKYPQILSEFTFTNLFCWRKTSQGIISDGFAEMNDHLILRFQKNGQKYFAQPMGPNPAEMIKALLKLFPDYNIIRVQESVANQLVADELQVEHLPNLDDYLYVIQDLKNLPGKKYDGKRNFIKQCELYSPTVRTIDDTNTQECLDFQKHWFQKHHRGASDDLDTENEAIKELFDNFKILNVFGICVFIDGIVQGFAVGERLNSDTVVEYFEKANTEFKGIYQYTLHSFVNSIPNDFTFLNREEDMGIAGIRKSKLSYHPVGMTKKYLVMPKTKQAEPSPH